MFPYEPEERLLLLSSPSETTPEPLVVRTPLLVLRPLKVMAPDDVIPVPPLMAPALVRPVELRLRPPEVMVSPPEATVSPVRPVNAPPLERIEVGVLMKLVNPVADAKLIPLILLVVKLVAASN